MCGSYENLVSALQKAGFFVTSSEDMGGWERVTVCSKRRRDGQGYCGNSFWVTQLGGTWYLGTWRGTTYSVKNETTVVAFAADLLSHEPNRALSSFPDEFRRRHMLAPVADSIFELEIERGQCDHGSVPPSRKCGGQPGS